MAFCVRGATFGGAETKNPVDRLSALPLFTVDVRWATVVSPAEASGARLAGLAITLPAISGDTLASIAGVQQDLLKALEKVELPVAPAIGAGLVVTGRELPWPTIIAFAGGALMLLALGVFGGALIKMSMEDNRKNRRLRRRYAP